MEEISCVCFLCKDFLEKNSLCKSIYLFARKRKTIVKWENFLFVVKQKRYKTNYIEYFFILYFYLLFMSRNKIDIVLDKIKRTLRDL